MSHKTFISYKYSDIVEGKTNNLRDRIISAMGEDARFYNGERIDSPDMTGLKAETIKSNLKDMIFNTSVTIVILSPNMLDSKWVPWEIEYSLSCYTRDGRQSKQNGIVAVIQKVNGDYSIDSGTLNLYSDGNNLKSVSLDTSKAKDGYTGFIEVNNLGYEVVLRLENTIVKGERIDLNVYSKFVNADD